MHIKINDLFINIEQVISLLGIEIVKGNGEWVSCLCPFHIENTPSFSINLEHGGWICFHDDLRGSILDLISMLESIPRGEASHWLKKHLKQEEVTTSDIVQRLLEKKQFDPSLPIKWANRYDSLPINLMSEYFFSRGFTIETMRKFGVKYDKQSNSLLFPVRDSNVNLISFIERRIPPFSKSKYLYPQGFHKTLFPLDHFQGPEVILVEGPLDAMWLHQYNEHRALALLGCTIEQKQLQWLQANTTVVILAFDNDLEGRRATENCKRKLAGFTLKKVELPQEIKDVQEVKGEALQQFIDTAKLYLI